MSASQAERRRFKSGHPLKLMGGQESMTDQLRLPQLEVDALGLISCTTCGPTLPALRS